MHCKVGDRARDVGYVEAHGTGTAAGDPVELSALGAVLGEKRDSAYPFLVGSIKTNIGHTEGAAGVAGLIKATLSVKHRRVPGSLHFVTPNPAIPWAELPLTIPTGLTPWPMATQRALAGVSSFGISGTNAHVVVAEPVEDQVDAGEPALAARPHLLALSARSPEALEALTREYRNGWRPGPRGYHEFARHLLHGDGPARPPRVSPRRRRQHAGGDGGAAPDRAGGPPGAVPRAGRGGCPAADRVRVPRAGLPLAWHGTAARGSGPGVPRGARALRSGDPRGGRLVGPGGARRRRAAGAIRRDRRRPADAVRDRGRPRRAVAVKSSPTPSSAWHGRGGGCSYGRRTELADAVR